MELGIDLGTSNTVAFLRRDDGLPEQVLFDGSPLLPSAVFCDSDGTLHVGRDALHYARARPERLESSPKRRIDEGTVFLGQEVTVEQLFAALLRRVSSEARRIGGLPVSRSTLSHPASWGQSRRDILARAAWQAELGEVRLVSEPVAAAAFHLRRHLWAAPDSTDLLVYDLGGGTFDVAVVRHEPGAVPPVRVICSAGLDDTGGQDIDAAIVGLLRSRSAPTDPAWERLDAPATAADQRLRRQLWDDVRATKEMLSRGSTAGVYVPLLETDELVTRSELEALALPLLQRTVNAIHSATATLTTPVRPFGAVILVGGASRMPLVATMLHRALGLAPTVIEQPELVVAAGCLDPLLMGAPLQPSPAPVSTPPMTSGPPVSPVAQPVSPVGYPVQAPGYPPLAGHPQQPPVGYPQQPQAGYPPQPPVGYLTQPPVGYPTQPPVGYPPQAPSGYPPQAPSSQPFPLPAGYHGPPQMYPTQPAPQALRPAHPQAWTPPPLPVALARVEVIELTMPTHQGLTLRGHLRAGGVAVEYVFPTDDDGTLLLFSDVDALARYAAQHRHADPLFSTPPAPRSERDAEELIFNLDLLLEHLAEEPDEWSPPFIRRCRDVCAQLANFLGLDEAQDALDKDTPIDLADDVLRKAGPVLGRGAKRRLHQFDLEFLRDEWETLVTLLDEASLTVGP